MKVTINLFFYYLFILFCYSLFLKCVRVSHTNLTNIVHTDTAPHLANHFRLLKLKYWAQKKVGFKKNRGFQKKLQNVKKTSFFTFSRLSDVPR